MSCQLPEAFPVNCMTTGHFVRCTARAEEKLLTDWAIGLVLSTFAVMVGVQTLVDTHSAIMAVLEIFGAANPTKPTVRTMVWLFVIRHPQITDAAMIFSKLNSTGDAIVPGVPEKGYFE